MTLKLHHLQRFGDLSIFLFRIIKYSRGENRFRLAVAFRI